MDSPQSPEPQIDLDEVLTEDEYPQVTTVSEDVLDVLYDGLSDSRKESLRAVTTRTDLETYIKENLLPKALLAYEYLLTQYQNPKLLKETADKITELSGAGPQKHDSGGVGVAINIDKNFFQGMQNGLKKVASDGEETEE